MEARRLLHGRPKGLEYNIDFIPPFIIIDSFIDLNSVQLSNIVRELPESEGIFYRNRSKREPFVAIKGEVPASHFLLENGLKYELNFQNQNLGLFMDMRPGRELIRKLSKDRKILNLFSYTCSFSVVAKAGGAQKVLNVDMKKSFLKTGERNHQLNNLQGGVSYLSYDIMKSLSGLKKKGPYDLIIIDPPSFQKSFDLKKSYPKLLSHATQWLGVGGNILACLNDPKLTSDFLVEIGNDLQVEDRLYGAFNDLPEQGLKMVLFTK